MSNKDFTSQSESGFLKSVIIKRPETAFISENKIAEEWERLNFLDRVNLKNAVNEYDYFESILRQNGTEIFHFPEHEEVSMDSIYCRDSSIITDHGVILCAMGKDARKPEPNAVAEYYKKVGLPILGTIHHPGRLEGGDVAWLDDNTLAVANGYRTNDDGFNQLKDMLYPYGIELVQVDLPHYKGPSDVFHLMSIFSPVDEDLAVVYSHLMPVRFRELLLARGYELVEVPGDEFDSMGCNVLALGPGKCLLVQGNPKTKNNLEAAGCEVITYPGFDISIKGGGGPTCLTRPLRRSRSMPFE